MDPGHIECSPVTWRFRRSWLEALRAEALGSSKNVKALTREAGWNNVINFGNPFPFSDSVLKKDDRGALQLIYLNGR